ncbi:MAG: TonB-dependent receptor [bacterium]|nr:TonB-dependent receptor [bacterium]
MEVISSHLQGMVIDDTDRPIVGASIILFADGRPVGGGATDAYGRFRIPLTISCNNLEIRVSSIGFQEYRQSLTTADCGRALKIACEPKAVELSAITVRPAPEPSLMKLAIPSRQITALSSRSLVVTNPTAALQYPQIARIGSSHSTQIRINGTSPIFHLNGISIGSDPNHFGMFSVVPATIVEQIDFRPQGTDASFGLPSVIDFKTISAFENRSTTEINFSTMELTGTVRKSDQSKYLIGAARKSILDHIVNSFDLSEQQATIPPTSFSDLFLSTGLKLSSHWQLGLDQYHVRDYLAFNTANNSDLESAVQTYQRARENYIGLRLNGIYGNTLVTTTLAVRDGRRSYEADPDEKSKKTSVHVDLEEELTTYLGNLTAETDLGNWQVRTGGQIEVAPNRYMTLTQNNWNLLPPFNTSDNPYIYQVALNSLHGNDDITIDQQSIATFASVRRSLGPLSITGGIRHQTFKHLASDALNGRFSATLRTGEQSNLTLFYGGFAEDPITTVLESYQVLIRTYAADLRPVSTDLIAADYTLGPAKLSLFHKTQHDLPEMSPDFDHVYASPGELNPDFLRMRSAAKVVFNGGSLSLDLPKLLSNRLSLYGSYAYTEATKTEHNVSFPYEANAKHRMQTQIEYGLSKKVKIGTELFVRSGYHYSQTRQMMYYTESSTYNDEFYTNMLSRENSLSFPMNAALNVYANFSLGDVTLSLAVTNATNRYNPIIKSPSGYIYDAGILPSIGLRWQL